MAEGPREKQMRKDASDIIDDNKEIFDELDD